MHVKTRLYGSLTELVGFEEVELELSEGSNLRDLLKTLTDRFGPMFQEALAESILQLEEGCAKDPAGTMNSNGPPPLTLVSEHIVKSEDELNTKLKEGVRLTIIPIVSGG